MIEIQKNNFTYRIENGNTFVTLIDVNYQNYIRHIDGNYKLDTCYIDIGRTIKFFMSNNIFQIVAKLACYKANSVNLEQFLLILNIITEYNITAYFNRNFEKITGTVIIPVNSLCYIPVSSSELEVVKVQLSQIMKLFPAYDQNMQYRGLPYELTKIPTNTLRAELTVEDPFIGYYIIQETEISGPYNSRKTRHLLLNHLYKLKSARSTINNNN